MQPLNTKSYYRLSDEQIEKIGNAMIYLSERIPNLSKTKLLKLLYMLDEASIIKSGLPFFNLQYKVWKLGPVSEEMFIELSDKLIRLDKFITTKTEDNATHILPKSEFCDDEFSDNDMGLLEHFVEMFKNVTAKELISYTHRPNAPWHKTACENGVYEMLERGEINNTELIIDMGVLVEHDEHKKSILEQYIEEK